MSPYNPPPISNSNSGQNPGPFQSPNERNWAMLCHLSALAGFIGVPYGNVLGPLIVWLLKKNDSPFIDQQGKESLNFHLSIAIYGTLAALSVFILIGFVLFPLVYLFGLIYTIIGAIAASDGKQFRYPLTIPFLK